MKTDIDRLMVERDMSALIVPVHEVYSPFLDYLVGGVRITHGMAVKIRDHAPVIIAHGMETEEAAATGHQVYSMAEMGFYDVLKSAGNDATRAEVAFIPHCLARLGVAGGKIGIYGVGHLHKIVAQMDALRADYPAYTFVGESGRTLFDEAAITKDADEISRIRAVAAATNSVLARTWDFIASHRAGDDETVIDADGQPLLIGDVRRFILGALLAEGLEDTGMIFAQGRDAGIPHSRGRDEMPLKLGQSIVFDLFPRERGGGYHHDVTRTWCIGHVPEAVQTAYDQVMTAFDISVEVYKPGMPTRQMQAAVQDYFEAQGHPTARTHPGTDKGYVHSLGHGLGLQVHEKPGISHLSKEDVFEAGNVITIEPGLYYPADGYGVRVEDTFCINADGTLESLTPFKKDILLKLRG